MILYRKGTPLRIRRYAAPAAPFWCATAIAPYSPKRATPVAIDYLSLHASGVSEKLEVGVSEGVRDELERAKAIDGPVLIDAAENAEVVFRRGEDVLAFCEAQGLGAVHVITTPRALPAHVSGDATIVLATWKSLGDFAPQARWGVAVPVLFPITTDLALLDALANAAKANGASFFAAIGLEVEPTAKQALAQSLALDAEDDRYAMLFHGGLEPLHLATERHIAALAHERGMADFIVPPRWSERTNWNAAVLLSLAASRMIAMELDLELAGTIARSARVIAELDKPLVRVAESASLSIIGGLDETSAEALTSWIAGEEPSFLEFVNEQWRMSRTASGGAPPESSY